MKAVVVAIFCVSALFAVRAFDQEAERRSLLAAGPSVPLVDPSQPEYFIEIRDGSFVNGCSNFKIAGWNQWEVVEAAAGAPSLSGASIPPGMTGPQLVRTLLQRGSTLGFNVMRTWAHAVNPQYALQPKPGQFSEATFQGLDYFLDEARKAGVKVILAFTSNWTPTGGLPEFVKWAGLSDPNQFFTDPTAKQMYKDTVKAIIMRRNTVNGRLNRDDPVIMAWDLLNEPRCVKCAPGTVAAWYAEMAAYVKSLDPNHLVTTGEEGFYATSDNKANPGAAGGSTWAADEGQDFIGDHASPNIDFATMHSWPDNWGDVTESFQRTWIQQHVMDAAQVLKKPIVFEEWGKWVNTSANASVDDRNRFMQIAYQQIQSLMQEPNSPLQGSAFWQWYAPGQEAAPTEGGGSGLFGIRETDAAFSLITDNIKFIQGLNGPVPGCSLAAHKAAPVAPVNDCRSTWVNNRPGTGYDGPDCKTPINECVRGTADCDKNAACIDTDSGYDCRCFFAYDGDGKKCTPNNQALLTLQHVYWSEPNGLSCKPGLPVDYPDYSPGFKYDPMNSFAFFVTSGGGKLGSKSNVTLTQCMIACQMAPTCESFVYNDVLQQCFLSRGQCPEYNYCQGEQAKCVSTNDRGGQFSFDCGYWVSFYRLDADVQSACQGFTPNPLSVGTPNPAALAPFAAYKQANPGVPVRSTPPMPTPGVEPGQVAAASVPLVDTSAPNVQAAGK